MKVLEIMQRKGFSIEKVAEAIGMSYTTLRLSVGDGADPRVSILRKVAEVIGCNITEFFEDEVKVFPITKKAYVDYGDDRFHLREIIAVSGISQSQFARELDLTVGGLRNMIERQTPTVSKMKQIAQIAHCDMFDLIGATPFDHTPILDISRAISVRNVRKKDIAAALGVSDVAFSVMLRTNNPPYRRLREIADYLGCRVSELFV